MHAEAWNGFTRFNFDARLSPRDLRDTFAVPFEACVRANVASLMCSYNKSASGGRGLAAQELEPGARRTRSCQAPALEVLAAGGACTATQPTPPMHSTLPSPATVNGFPACNNKELLETLARGQMGFEGFVSTDCEGAVKEAARFGSAIAADHDAGGGCIVASVFGPRAAFP